MNSNRFRHLNRFFDRIYVLSIKRATKRHRKLQEHLAGLDWHYFWGIDKRNLNAEIVCQQNLYDDAGHRQLKRTSRSMSLGEVACALSHRAIFEDVLANGYRNALILEDDVLPQPQADQAFAQSLSSLPKDWELLMLGYYSEKYKTPFSMLQRQVYLLYHHLQIANWHNVEKQFIRKMLMKKLNNDWYRIGKLVGGHGYAVTRSACEKFVALQTPIILQADRIFSHLALLDDLKAYAIKEKVFGLSDLANQSYIEYPNLVQKLSSLGSKNKPIAHQILNSSD